MRVGCHLSIGKGFEAMAAVARGLGCETVQVFSRSPRGGKAKPIDPVQVDKMKRILSQAGMEPLCIHVPYFINLASFNEHNYGYSREVIKEDLERAAALGAAYLVTHVGHAPAGEERPALERVAAAVNEALAEKPVPVMLLLENTAGQGQEVGNTFRDLAFILDRVRERSRTGICFDTCHGFAAGYELTTPEGVEEALAEFQRDLGLENLRLVHANDSRGVRGCHLDRHANIGQGHIGTEGFRLILARPEFRDVPFILETPVGDQADFIRDITALKSLRPGEP